RMLIFIINFLLSLCVFAPLRLCIESFSVSSVSRGFNYSRNCGDALPLPQRQHAPLFSPFLCQFGGKSRASRHSTFATRRQPPAFPPTNSAADARFTICCCRRSG